MKLILFEDTIYKRKIERSLYHYCALRQPRLWMFVFSFVLYRVIRYFRIISNEKYLEKRWSFLGKVENRNSKIRSFSAKIKKSISYQSSDITIVTNHPSEIVSKIMGKTVIGSEYDIISGKFTLFRDVTDYSKEKEYTAYGSLFSPIMRNASKRVYIYGKHKYNSAHTCIIALIFRYIISLCVILVVSVFWSVVAMYFSASAFSDPRGLFLSYFDSRMLILLNVLPVVVLCAGLWVITNSITFSCAFSGLITLVLSIINYFKLLFRNDPFMFEDISLISEAGNISSRYDIKINRNMIIAFAALLISSLLIRLFFELRSRITIRFVRPCLFFLLCSVVFFGSPWYMDGHFYYLNQNLKCINKFSATEQYISRGFVYPFIYSINTAIDSPPEGYNETVCRKKLSSFHYEDIPVEKRVNIISIMLEAYTDFDRFDVLNFSDNVYSFLHDIRKESYSGYLVDDIFAAGTVTTERQFLSGLNKLPNFRTSTNSYLWYLRQQGYTVEGSHPNYSWFYNRININEHLGFERYLFDEDLYYELAGCHTCGNDIVIPEIYNLFKNAISGGKNYFSFSVTYQGHAPYSDSFKWFDHEYVANKGYSEAEYNILNNYFYNIDITNRELNTMVEKLRMENEPVILIFFGDHMPWLGNNASVYKTIGIDFDLSTMEGFKNYYSTPYIVWANDKAKEICGNDFKGDGGDIGAYMLMNRVFSMAGWKGDEFNQYLSEVSKKINAVTSVGAVFSSDGQFSYSDNCDLSDEIREYECMQYYWKKNFAYSQSIRK